MTLEQKQKRLEELRVLYKSAKTEIDRKIIIKRAELIKRTIKTLV